MPYSFVRKNRTQRRHVVDVNPIANSGLGWDQVWYALVIIISNFTYRGLRKCADFHQVEMTPPSELLLTECYVPASELSLKTDFLKITVNFCEAKKTNGAWSSVSNSSYRAVAKIKPEIQ